MDSPLWGSSTRSVDGIGIPPLGSSQSDTWLSMDLIPLGVGLDGILHQRKNRNTRDLVRRV
jgi:hypothetical protein